MVRDIQLACWLPSSTPSMTEAMASRGMNTAISGSTCAGTWVSSEFRWALYFSGYLGCKSLNDGATWNGLVNKLCCVAEV
jgi:hypothetical protein